MKKVLIVDDAAFMRMALKRLLENNGFQVVGEAENGAVGVKLFKEHQPDVVTLDITMPEMDGIQALKAIRQINPDVKVVMVSAMGQECMVKEAIVNGAKSFIVKPFKEEHVVSVLNKIAAM